MNSAFGLSWTRHAFYLRKLLFEDRGGSVVELALAARVRGQREHDDRRVGRIDLAVYRVGAKARRQVDARGVDRRLDVAGRTVDVAVEAELQDDPR